MRGFGWLKWGIIAFIVGEFLALSKKDTTFRRGIKKATWWDKLYYAADSLFNLNRELVDDAQEAIDFGSLKTRLDEGVERVKEEYEFLQDQIMSLTEKPQADMQELVADLSARFENLKEGAQVVKKQLSGDFPLDEKLDELKKLIADLAKKSKSK